MIETPLKLNLVLSYNLMGRARNSGVRRADPVIVTYGTTHSRVLGNPDRA